VTEQTKQTKTRSALAAIGRSLDKLPWETEPTAVYIDPEGFATVLARRENGAIVGHPYVTWAWSPFGGLYAGHYDLDLEAGWLDFTYRVGLVD
jgi:hypothetical protein